MSHPGALPGHIARSDDTSLEREACRGLITAPEETQRLQVLVTLVYDADTRTWVIERFRGAYPSPPKKVSWHQGMQAFKGLHVRRQKR